MDFSQVEIDKFKSSFEVGPPDKCWEWSKGILSTGYGGFYITRGSRNTFNSHRISWEIHNKDHIPKGKLVCHTCDNRKCVNPNHLYIGTHTDNNRDTIDRARGNRVTGDKCSWTKITDLDAIAISRSNELQTVLAKRYKVHQSTISDIKRGKRRSLVTGLTLKL